jgi:8-oxo-dGTP pyrophosphatase MutT (NUDIX family)
MPDSLQAISAAEIRRRLAGTRMPEDPLAVDMGDISKRMPESVVSQLATNLRPAGVLIPIVERQESLNVLLTERSAELRHHAGQVSFPGGGMEAHDADITATALREAREEVGIEAHEVDIAGYLNPTPTVTGFAVTPVIGFVRESFILTIDPAEVQTAFEVPLDFLMDQRNEEHSEREFEGITIPVVTFHYDGHRIWGATAAMLLTMRQLLVEQ